MRVVDTANSSDAMGRRRALVALVLAAVAFLPACVDATGTPRATAPDDDTETTEEPGQSTSSDREAGDAELQVLATGFEAPWGLAFLPDGDALITERDTSRIWRLSGDGQLAEVGHVEEADGEGEGGLLGIAVSPEHITDELVYVYYTTPSDNRVARFRLGESLEPVLTDIPAGRRHNGGRIAFGPDGMLYVGTGDAGREELSQDPGSLGGKILRIRPDGGVPADNPVPGSPVYSLGHRNVQGLAWDSMGRLFATEFGQDRFDEVNAVVAGGNYGWPQAEGDEGGDGFIRPVTTWTTDEASPSGSAIVGDTMYVAGLGGQRLWTVPLNPDGTAGQSVAGLTDFGRLRHVAAAPDGSLWVLTSNRDGRGDPTADDDRVLRLPAALLTRLPD